MRMSEKWPLIFERKAVTCIVWRDTCLWPTVKLIEDLLHICICSSTITQLRRSRNVGDQTRFKRTNITRPLLSGWHYSMLLFLDIIQWTTKRFCILDFWRQITQNCHFMGWLYWEFKCLCRASLRWGCWASRQVNSIFQMRSPSHHELFTEKWLIRNVDSCEYQILTQ